MPSPMPLHGQVLDAYRQIASRIVSGEDAEKARESGAIVVSLVSRSPREGVSTVSRELAMVLQMGRHGRVLLIDGSSAKSTSAREKSGAARELTLEAVEQQSNERPFPESYLSRAGADGIVAMRIADSSILNSEAWPDAFQQMRQLFDVILVDTGSMASDTPYLWSRYATRALLVVDVQRTGIQELERLRFELTHSGLHPDAVILNKKKYYVPGFLYRHLQ